MGPQANALIHLTPFLGDDFRWRVMGLVLISIFGTFVWDRLCVAIFAPEIFRAMLQSARRTSFQGDLIPLAGDFGKIIAGFVLFSIGVPGWIMLFMWWKNRKRED